MLHVYNIQAIYKFHTYRYNRYGCTRTVYMVGLVGGSVCVCMCVCVCACACVPFIKASSYQGVLIRSPPPHTQLIQMYIHIHTCVYLANSSGDMVKDCSLVLDMNNTALSCKHMNLHVNT